MKSKSGIYVVTEFGKDQILFDANERQKNSEFFKGMSPLARCYDYAARMAQSGDTLGYEEVRYEIMSIEEYREKHGEEGEFALA